jgi:hypothetical protein
MPAQSSAKLAESVRTEYERNAGIVRRFGLPNEDRGTRNG